MLGERRLKYRDDVARILEENPQFRNGPESYWQSREEKMEAMNIKFHGFYT